MLRMPKSGPEGRRLPDGLANAGSQVQGHIDDIRKGCGGTHRIASVASLRQLRHAERDLRSLFA